MDDLVAAHYEAAPALRTWDEAIMGGSLMDLPEPYQERNWMTYVDSVSAPVLLIEGKHDDRYPIGQAMLDAHALRRLGREMQVRPERRGPRRAPGRGAPPAGAGRPRVPRAMASRNAAADVPSRQGR